MAEISSEFKEQYMKDKFQYDSLSQAIKIAKDNKLTPAQIKPITEAKAVLKAHCVKQNEALLSMMPDGDNLMHLQDSWYAVRHLNDKNGVVCKQECLKPEDLNLIRRDGRYEPELRRSQYEDLLPAILNDEALSLYKLELRANATNLVLQYTGMIFAPEEDQEVTSSAVTGDQAVVPSTHAGTRWVQRKMGIHAKDDRKAEEYRRVNYTEVVGAIMDSYNKAEQVWLSDRDGVAYCYNEADNIMFVVGGNTIITLYTEDFGFSPDMNRMIVREQLKVLSKSYEGLKTAEKEQDAVLSTIEQGMQDISSEIALLEAKMALLVAERASLNATKDKTSKVVRVARSSYDVEFDKLFNKWDA